MKLFYRTYGQGFPVIVLHGLFGLSDNWQTFAKQLCEFGYQVITVDQRNHGLSPHHEAMNYQVMAQDIENLIDELGFEQVILIGHSMGGKTILQCAANFPYKIKQLFVVDICGKYYAPHHQLIIDALNSIDLLNLTSRKDAEVVMQSQIKDAATCMFLLKNLYRTETGNFAWRFNLPVIVASMENICASIDFERTFTMNDFDIQFIRGARSHYILDSDIPSINETFCDASIITIRDAGHWVHAEQPVAFLNEVVRVIKK